MPSNGAVPGAALLAVALLAACTGPRGPATGPVSELASPAGEGAAEPNLAASPAGDVYLSWLEPLVEGGHALRFSVLQGDSWTPARTIASGTGWFVNWADFPSLLALGGGRLAAHWLVRSGPTTYAYDVRIARSPDDGATWSEPITPHRDGTQSEHGFVSLWAHDGDVAAVWLDGRKFPAAELARRAGDTTAVTEMTLRYAVIRGDGSLTDEVELDGRICDCCQTGAALTADGPVVVYRDRSPGEIRDVMIVRRTGGTWTEPRSVSDDGWHIPACPVNGPAIEAEGRLVVVAWFTAANDERRVYAAFSTDAGATFAPRVRVDEGRPIGRVDVILDGAGDAVVSWLEETGEGAEVRVRRVTGAGRTGPASTVARTGAGRASGFPRMLRSGSRVVFAWTEPGTAGPSRVRTAVARLER